MIISQPQTYLPVGIRIRHRLSVSRHPEPAVRPSVAVFPRHGVCYSTIIRVRLLGPPSARPSRCSSSTGCVIATLFARPFLGLGVVYPSVVVWRWGGVGGGKRGWCEGLWERLLCEVVVLLSTSLRQSLYMTLTV